MYGLLIPDFFFLFCFSKVKHNILLPQFLLTPFFFCDLRQAVMGVKNNLAFNVRTMEEPADAV